MKYIFFIIVLLYLYAVILQYKKFYEGNLEILQVSIINMRPEIVAERKPVVVMDVKDKSETRGRLRLMYIISRNGGSFEYDKMRVSKCKYTLIEGDCKLAIHSPYQAYLIRENVIKGKMRVKDYGICEGIYNEVPSISVVLKKGMTLILPVHWGYTCIEGKCNIEYLHDMASLIMTSIESFV